MLGLVMESEYAEAIRKEKNIAAMPRNFPIFFSICNT